MKCFYHPAPMTRNNSDFRQYRVEKQQTRPTTRKSKAQVNPPNQEPDGDDIVPDPAPSSYLGFFSTLSLCQRLWPVATPRWSIPSEDKLSKFKAIEPPLRKVMAYSHRLEAIVRQYRDGMHFIVIPQHLLFDPVLLFLQELGTRSDQEAFAKDILKTAKGNLRLRLAPMTPELGLSDFLRILRTERIRLEFLSLVFSLCGLTSLYADVDGFDATAFATEMYNASKYCLKICRSHNQLNDITVWSSFINTMFLSSLFGNASTSPPRNFKKSTQTDLRRRYGISLVQRIRVRAVHPGLPSPRLLASRWSILRPRDPKTNLCYGGRAGQKHLDVAWKAAADRQQVL